MLRLERIGKIYPTGEVLRDVTWEIKPGDRIAVASSGMEGTVKRIVTMDGDLPEAAAGDAAHRSARIPLSRHFLRAAR